MAKHDTRQNAKHNTQEFKAFQRSVIVLIALTACLLASLIYLSDTSLYYIRGLTRINLDIALVFTPWGMIHNIVLYPQHWLRPVYNSPADRWGLFQDPALRLSIAAIWSFAIGLLVKGYRPTTDREKFEA
jgi:hypothetical protein